MLSAPTVGPGDPDGDEAAKARFTSLLLATTGSTIAALTAAQLTAPPLSPCFAWLKVLAERRCANTVVPRTGLANTPLASHSHAQDVARGAPVLECNRWLQAYLEGPSRPLTRRQLYLEWLRRHEAETGFIPSDPRGSFRHALKGCLARIRSEA